MEIQPMELVWRSLNPIQQQDVSEDPQSTMFAEIFDSVIDSVKETDAEKNEKMYELATGQLDNPAEVTIAATQAELSVCRRASTSSGRISKRYSAAFGKTGAGSSGFPGKSF